MPHGEEMKIAVPARQKLPLQSSHLRRSPAAPSCSQSLPCLGLSDLPEGKGSGCRTGHLQQGLPGKGGRRASCHHREPVSTASRCSRRGCGDLAFSCLPVARVAGPAVINDWCGGVRLWEHLHPGCTAFPAPEEEALEAQAD